MRKRSAHMGRIVAAAAGASFALARGYGGTGVRPRDEAPSVIVEVLPPVIPTRVKLKGKAAALRERMRGVARL